MASLFIVSCGSGANSAGDTVINGHFKNASGDSLYISKLLFDRILDTDTIIIDSDGKFTYSFNPENTQFYVLAHKGPNYIRLIIEQGEHLDITADLSYLPGTYEVKGSKNSELLKTIESRIINAQHTIDSLTMVLQAVKGSPDFEIKFPELDSLYKANFNLTKDFMKALILEHPASLASVVAINQSLDGQGFFNEYDNLDLYLMLNDSVFKKYPNNSFAMNLQNRVVEMKIKDKERKRIQAGLQPGLEAPDILINDINGQPVQLSALRGKVVVLKFWDSHCQNCKQENIKLKELYGKYKNKGLEIFAVSIDLDKGELLEYLKGFQYNWIHCWLYDQPQDAPMPVASSYFIEKVPLAHLIDRDGKFIATNLVGPMLEDALKEVFK